MKKVFQLEEHFFDRITNLKMGNYRIASNVNTEDLEKCVKHTKTEKKVLIVCIDEDLFYRLHHILWLYISIKFIGR